MPHSAQTIDTKMVSRLEDAERPALGLRFSTIIIFCAILMLIAVGYVGLHIRMTQLEYNMAAELNIRQQALEDQKKLKLELAMLKSPQRIESIAKNKLQMSYPESGQVITLKVTDH
jgi:cell division protein FtsL